MQYIAISRYCTVGSVTFQPSALLSDSQWSVYLAPRLQAVYLLVQQQLCPLHYTTTLTLDRYSGSDGTICSLLDSQTLMRLTFHFMQSSVKVNPLNPKHFLLLSHFPHCSLVFYCSI